MESQLPQADEPFGLGSLRLAGGGGNESEPLQLGVCEKGLLLWNPSRPALSSWCS